MGHYDEQRYAERSIKDELLSMEPRVTVGCNVKLSGLPYESPMVYRVEAVYDNSVDLSHPLSEKVFSLSVDSVYVTDETNDVMTPDAEDYACKVLGAKKKQVGGDHYQKAIQPIDYINKNKLDYFQGNVIKYTTRHKDKGGAQDVRKAIHYLEMILEFDYGERA